MTFSRKTSVVMWLCPGPRPDLIPWLVSSHREKTKYLKRLTEGKRDAERGRKWLRKAGEESISRNHHEGGVVLPFLPSLVSQTQSRWHGQWARWICSVVAGTGTSLRFVQASNSLQDVWGRRYSAAVRTCISGPVQTGAPDADQTVQPERRLPPEDFTRWNCEWWQARKWPLRWGRFLSFWCCHLGITLHVTHIYCFWLLTLLTS